MEQHIDLFRTVYARLRSVRYSDLSALAQQSGVPESTLKKIRSGEVRDPRISTAQALYDYFEKQGPQEAGHA